MSSSSEENWGRLPPQSPEIFYDVEEGCADEWVNPSIVCAGGDVVAEVAAAPELVPFVTPTVDDLQSHIAPVAKDLFMPYEAPFGLKSQSVAAAHMDIRRNSLLRDTFSFARRGFNAARRLVTGMIQATIQYAGANTSKETGIITTVPLLVKSLKYDSTPSKKIRLMAKYKLDGAEQTFEEYSEFKSAKIMVYEVWWRLVVNNSLRMFIGDGCI